MKGCLLFFMSILSCSQIFGQNKIALDEKAYFTWNSIEHRQISDDGQWLFYELVPNKGDKRLVITNTSSFNKQVISRGEQAHLDEAHQMLVCLVKPEESLLDSLKRKKIKEDQMPSDTLMIVNLSNGNRVSIPNVKSFQYPQQWDGWIYYEIDPDPDTSFTNSLPRKLEEKEHVYICHRLADNLRDTLTYVESLLLAEENPTVYLIQNSADSVSTSAILQLNPIDHSSREIFTTTGIIKQLSTSKNGDRLTWLVDADTSQHDLLEYELYYRDTTQLTKIIARKDEPAFPKNWIISENFQPIFSPENQRIFFGVSPPPLLQDTSLLPNEIVEVEIWNYQDQVLYTQQKVQEKNEKKRTYLFACDLQENAIIPLGTTEIPEVVCHPHLELEWAIGIDNKSMQKYLSWEGRIYKDLYLISLLDGAKKQIKTRISGNPQWSSSGQYIYWYEEPDTTWYAYSIENEKLLNLTSGDRKFSDELNDVPDHPSPYGSAGWSAKDEFVFLYDRYDIWKIDPTLPSGAKRLTQGRESKTQYRYVKLDTEEKYLPEQQWLLRGFNENNKDESYVSINLETGEIISLVTGAFQLDRQPLKAKNTDKIVFTKETFTHFPDLYMAAGHNFSHAPKVTDANPQQTNYLWGTIELVNWISPDGQSLQGLLVKPANFDPSGKYPMIVNFYERSSDDLHNHRAPFPHRSTINYSYYASNGYVIFNPDITYKVGYPGESAFNNVISGTQAIVDMGFVDPGRIGLQGHSWGGYQIAHIITKTNMFACAESGAPVVNMVSAYGGIRWGTGMSRMFQYEHTQSRLGATLWERPDLYLENSPIFNIDKINTPVLILHNDEDSAVPWYQGIEFFVAMRRLNKPAWLLNYNGEPHWPLKWQNRLDFNRRLFQFFEHYLKGAPIPQWMKVGIPAIEKGINTGLELSVEK